MKNEKCGYISIIGNTNTGKSTLINLLFGKKISIISKKIQTTIEKVIAIKTFSNIQMILIDTPGIHSNKGLNVKQKNINIFDIEKQSDIILVLLDVTKNNFELTISKLIEIKYTFKKIIIVLNKIDLISKEKLFEWVKNNKDLLNNYTTIPISALKKININKLMDLIIKYLPEQKFLFSNNNEVNYFSKKFILSMIREKTLYYLNQEIPYKLFYIINEKYYDDKKHIYYIFVTIITNKLSIKKIIIGKQGYKIKQISTAIRTELELLLKSKVFIKINISIKE